MPAPGPLGGPAAVAAAAMVYVPDPAAPVVEPDDRHHLLTVLRLRPGEPVVASDGSGTWCPCRVATSGGGADGGAVLVPDGPVRREPSPSHPVGVAFVPVKGTRPEWVVQKLTELGVDRIVPVDSARSVVRWRGERADRAFARLRRVAREAAAQARRAWLPELVPPSTLADLVAAHGADELALAQPGGGPPSLERPLVAVGPEGGWHPDELAVGVPTVGLGPTILRAETAAVTAGALLCALRSGVVTGSV